MKKPSKPEFWILFPRLLKSIFPFNSTKSTMCTESLENVQLGVSPGVFPWALPVGSRLPPTKRRSMERSLGKCKAAHRILAQSLTSLIHQVECLRGELSLDAVVGSEKFKRSPRGLKRSKNRFLGEIFIKHMYKQAHSKCFFSFFPVWKHWIIYGLFQQKRNAAIRGGWRMMISVGVILSLGVRPSGLFIFVFIRYVGGITGYIFKRNFIYREYCKLVYKY